MKRLAVAIDRCPVTETCVDCSELRGPTGRTVENQRNRAKVPILKMVSQSGCYVHMLNNIRFFIAHSLYELRERAFLCGQSRSRIYEQIWTGIFIL